MNQLCTISIKSYRSQKINNINPTSTSTKSKRGIVPSKVSEKPLVFSLKYFDTSNDKFHIEHTTVSYAMKIFEQLQILSKLSLFDAKKAGKALRFHSINFSENKVSENTLDIKDISLDADSNAYQFQLSKRRGRVVGFIISNIFYIKWLDPEHNLYPTKGITICPRGETDCDKKLEDKDKKILQYEELLEELTG